MATLFVFGFFVVIPMGIAGFTKRGLPFTAKRRITGRMGKIIGAVLIAFGIVMIVAGVSFATPTERERLIWLSVGAAIGAGATWLAMHRLWP